MSPDVFHVLIVIAPRNFRDEELSEPIRYLEDAGISYEVVSSERGLAVGILGGKVLVEKTLTDVATDLSSYSGIVIVGGGGAVDYLWNNSALHQIVRTMVSEGKIVSAICLSPVVLAKAGVLQGKKATVWNDDDAIAELRKGGAVFTSDPIVVDGTIITANGPSAAAGFGEKVTKSLKR